MHWGCDLALHTSSKAKSTMNSTGIEAICSSTDRLGKLTKSKFWSMAGASFSVIDAVFMMFGSAAICGNI